MLTCKHQVKTCLSKTAISTNSLWMVCKVAWNNKAFHLIAHTNQKMYPISSIWHKNMHQHLFMTIIIWCKTPTIFWEESSRKTQSYKEQPNGGYCVYYPSNIFEICEKNVYEQLTVLCSATTANCFLILN